MHLRAFWQKICLNIYHPNPPNVPPHQPLLQWRKLIWCLNIHSIFGHWYLTYLVLRPEYSRLAGSIKWLLIFCFLQSPGHQQLIYWYSNGFMEMNASLTHKEGSKYLCTLPRVETVKQLGPWNGLSIFVRWSQETVKQLGPWNGLSIFKRWRLRNSQAREAVLTLMALWWLCIPGNFYILS